MNTSNQQETTASLSLFQHFISTFFGHKSVLVTWTAIIKCYRLGSLQTPDFCFP